MRHDWRVTRRLEPHPDGQRRWDRAYQLLLEWAATGPTPGQPLASDPASSIHTSEDIDENRDLCACLDPTTGPDPDHRPADRPAAGASPRPRAGHCPRGTSSVTTATAAPRSSGPASTGSAIAAAMASFDRILITDPDRLARNYVHQVLLLEELQKHGCRVEFLDRPMSQDPHDQLLLQIRGAVAEYERTLIAERMRRGRQRQFQAGKMLPWTRAPYGYRMAADRPRDPSGVYQDPAEAAVVAEMFAWYLEGRHTLHGLVDHLHELGVPSPSGKPYWSGPSVRGILRNPVYTGRVYANRTRYRDAQVRRSATHPIGRPHGTADPAAGAGVDRGGGRPRGRHPGAVRPRPGQAGDQPVVLRPEQQGRHISPEVAGQLRGVRAGVPGPAAAAAEQLLRLHGQDASGPAPQRGDLRVAGTSRPRPSMTWSGRTSASCCGTRRPWRRRSGSRRSAAGTRRNSRRGGIACARGRRRWPSSSSG